MRVYAPPSKNHPWRQSTRMTFAAARAAEKAKKRICGLCAHIGEGHEPGCPTLKKEEYLMANEEAPEGSVYVCFACGKRSRDRYGSKKIDYGWDVSCMMNCNLVLENLLVIEGGRVVRIKEPEKIGD